MKCLSIKQPHANLIAEGEKIYEIRSWKTDYRGKLIIASSKNSEGYPDLPGGVLICLVELIDIVPFTPDLQELACTTIKRCLFQKKRHTLWAWKLKLIKPLPPLPITGRLNLYDLPTSIVDKIQ